MSPRPVCFVVMPYRVKNTLAKPPAPATVNFDALWTKAVATLARLACERAMERNSSDEWLRPTLLGMAFDSGDVASAEDLYDQILTDGHATWKLDTMLADCEVSVRETSDPDIRRQLQDILDKLKALK